MRLLRRWLAVSLAAALVVVPGPLATSAFAQAPPPGDVWCQELYNSYTGDCYLRCTYEDGSVRWLDEPGGCGGGTVYPVGPTLPWDPCSMPGACSPPPLTPPQPGTPCGGPKEPPCAGSTPTPSPCPPAGSSSALHNDLAQCPQTPANPTNPSNGPRGQKKGTVNSGADMANNNCVPKESADAKVEAPSPIGGWPVATAAILTATGIAIWEAHRSGSIEMQEVSIPGLAGDNPASYYKGYGGLQGHKWPDAGNGTVIYKGNIIHGQPIEPGWGRYMEPAPPPGNFFTTIPDSFLGAGGPELGGAVPRIASALGEMAAVAAVADVAIEIPGRFAVDLEAYGFGTAVANTAQRIDDLNPASVTHIMRQDESLAGALQEQLAVPSLAEVGDACLAFTDLTPPAQESDPPK